MARLCPRPALAPLVALLLAGTGACERIQSLTGPDSPGPNPTSSATSVRYTAVGASDTIGYGGSVVCIPFAACPDGTGYVQTVARRLKAAHADFDSTNLGVPGTVVSRRIQDLGNSVGLGIVSNFTDGQAVFVPRNSTLVTLFAGGNDANAVARAIEAGRAPGSVEAYIDSQITAFGDDFRALIAAIRARATTARIVVLNLPNMARLPYTAGRTGTEREWFRRLTVGFSAAMNATRTSDVLVIDLMCHAPIYNAGIYSSDGFHPNDSGYAILADLVTGALTTPPAAPSASCGFMQ